jgi:hypothetical protein
MTMQIDLDRLRERFEHLATVQYMLSCMSKPNPNAQFPFEFKEMQPFAIFLAKKEDGSYEKETLDSAWWGFQQAFKEYAPKETKINFLENV